ncbi:PrsW family intramembrane metalloprotease [Halotia branconii]|uniref:PrsW family glutamic-type intramembrane protease n=1 Tax=Halotia branconii CENA392 TaxID=1539056 RepID=A0AAJ6NRG2_9CYAN|nr:PrsW family glutamic-type intramembrane protease [Halotia branconii]WGV25363.1 PrsW family glutamic-type intramembrane protease [Halotia branconii CENA392]
MADVSLVLWAAIPPLLLLGFYYCRVQFAPFWLRLILLFIFGAVSGFAALGLEWVFETVANWVVNWQNTRYLLPGIILRQLVEVGPIEEGCKLVAVVIPTCVFQCKYRLRPSSIFLFTIAVALGFTAEENWIYLFYGTASILDRIIGTPIHALFSAPWGYALGIYLSSTIRLNQDKRLIYRAWLNSVICHALVNVLSSAWRYSTPIRFLSYGLFPLLLWMFWRIEQLLRKVQGKRPIIVISGHTPQHRYWQRGLVMFALILGGNALFGLFLLAKTISPLSSSQLFHSNILWFILSRLLINLIFAIVAWLIYRYLRHSSRRHYL